MKELEYPFDSAYLLKKHRAIKRELLSEIEKGGAKLLKKKIAVLGGSTTHDITEMLDLFLLNNGIQAEFYESEYAQYWNDVMFGSALDDFSPDVIFIHTSTRNISEFPTVRDSREAVDAKLEAQFSYFEAMWQKAREKFGCAIIQNNFELPFYRLLGNRDVWDFRGKSNFVSRLNQRFYEYAQSNDSFFINDIAFLQAAYGLEKWSAPEWWHLYKYALAVDAIGEFSFNVANIIKALFGRNKKAMALDLDNTLWGGVVGDDGAENIEIGQETATAQVFAEFQGYIKAHKDLGVLLTVNSKNDAENALAGLNRPDSVLHPNDFVAIKANWESKDRNLSAIAAELNIGEDAFVFVDDNPAERSIVRANGAGAAVAELSVPERYIQTIDRSGFFELASFSADDLSRTEMYKANAERARQLASFADYGEYLRSLSMTAEILPFSPLYMSRIAQLTNKSNQFNLTTLRCTQSDIERMASAKDCITLYGKLCDKFGDNGVVSVVSAHIADSTAHIELWLMSCRVLKRGMEDAMMNAFVAACKNHGVREVFGYYYPTAKNKMVKDFYAQFGFALVSEDEAGAKTYRLSVDEYAPKPTFIENSVPDLTCGK